MPTTPDPVLDAKNALSIPNSGVTVHLCSAEPANFAGIAAVNLGKKAVTDTPTDADATPNGRMRSLPPQTGIPTPAQGSASHAVLSNDTDYIYHIAELNPPLAVQAGGTAGIGAITIRQADTVAAT